MPYSNHQPEIPSPKTLIPKAPCPYLPVEPSTPEATGSRALRYSPLVAHKTQTIYQGAAAGL